LLTRIISALHPDEATDIGSKETPCIFVESMDAAAIVQCLSLLPGKEGRKEIRKKTRQAKPHYCNTKPNLPLQTTNTDNNNNANERCLYNQNRDIAGLTNCFVVRTGTAAAGSSSSEVGS